MLDNIVIVLVCALSVAMVIFTIVFAVEMDKLHKRVNKTQQWVILLCKVLDKECFLIKIENGNYSVKSKDNLL